VTVRILVVCAALLIAAPAVAAAAKTPSPSPAPSAIPAQLSLSDAENIAMVQSPLLSLARAALAQAQSQVDLAQSAALPNLTGQASSSKSKSSSRGFNNAGGTGAGGASGIGSFADTLASVNLRQLIFDGGRVRAQVLAARYTTDAARLQLERQVQTVLFTVAQDYFQALQARHQLQAAIDSLRLAQTQEKLVQAQYRTGAAARADVLTAQLPVAQAQLAVAQAANGERTQIVGLLNAMGLASNVNVKLKDDTSAGGNVPSADAVLAIAQTSRPDLLAARAALQSAIQSVHAAQLQRVPQISANASDGVESTAPGAPGFGNSYSVGVSLAVPIFDGGAIRAQTESALAGEATAQANERTSELGITQTVEQAYLGLLTAQAGLTSATAELSQARTVLDVTNAQYKAGVTTLPLLLNAQVGLTKAETDYAVALYAFKIAQQNMLFAEGTLGNT